MNETKRQEHRQPAIETDARFPSGPWIGFWIQRGWGKQRMSLSLTFAEGRVCGEGRDVVGRFGCTGTYDLKSGRVIMAKHYYGAHIVTYDGANQGDGLWLWGMWKIRSDHGGFHLWPEGEDDPTQKRVSRSSQIEAPITPRLKEGELLGV